VETDYFNKTSFSVIKSLSLFEHSNILQIKVMETYNSITTDKVMETYDYGGWIRWPLKVQSNPNYCNKKRKKMGKTSLFSYFQWHSCSLCEITFSNNTFNYN